MTDETKSPITATSLEPLVTSIPSGVEFAYLEADEACPTIQLRDISKDRYGNLMCELTAFCVQQNMMIPITGVKFNLSSLPARKQTARCIKESYLDVSATWIDWEHIISDVCWRAVKLYKNGHEVEEIWPLSEIPKPEFLINPILPFHQPTIIFGDGGSGKGHIALTLAILAALPFKDNYIKFTTQDEPTLCLYLDYESDRADFERTLSGLCAGFGINVPIKRMRMTTPIADCVSQLRSRVISDSIGLLVVDSLGPAAGGNINDSEPAIKLFSALRQLPDVTTLIIAHNSKDPLNKTKSVFGSVFFTNLARSVWEIKKDQDEDSPNMTLVLKHKKFNRQRQLPIGLKFTFNNGNGCITTSRVDLADTELSSELPMYKQIESLLLSGSMTKTDIARTLGKTVADITPTLYKKRDGKGMFINLDGGTTWGVMAK